MKKILLILIGLNSFLVAELQEQTTMVYDTVTHLRWQNSYGSTASPLFGDVEKATWKDAISYCNYFNGFRAGWRLPNKKELWTIINHEFGDPAISSKFKQTLSTSYWTSTSNSNNLSEAWSVNFFGGSTDINDKNEVHAVRCVITY